MSIIAIFVFLTHFSFAADSSIKCIIDDPRADLKYIFVQNKIGPAMLLMSDVKNKEKCLVEYDFSNLYQGGRGPLRFFDIEFKYKKAKSCSGSQKNKVLKVINLSAKYDVADNIYNLSMSATPRKKLKECKEFVLKQQDVIDMYKRHISKKEMSAETKNFLIQRVKKK